MGSHEITLRWDAQDVGEHFASPNSVSCKNKTADYLLGVVTLDRLEAYSTYKVTIEAIEDGRSIENYSDEIETLPHCKSRVEQIKHNSTPRNDMPTYIGTERCAVTISGSASTSVISKVALTCIAGLLA